MAHIIPHTECETYHPRNNSSGNLFAFDEQEEAMAADDSKAHLWASVQALMRQRYGEENLNRLARDVRVGPATASRLKAKETSVGLDVVDKIAHAFGVPAWHLLAPGFDPAAPPVLPGASPMAQDIAQMIDAIEDDAHRRRAYALVVQTLQFGAPTLAQETGPAHAAAPIAAPSQHS